MTTRQDFQIMPPNLRADVFMTRADGVFVFLDLTADRYRALPQRSTVHMDAALAGAGFDPSAEHVLRAASLLARDDDEGRRMAVTEAEPVRGETSPASRVSPLQGLRAGVCRMLATDQLKRSPIAKIVAQRRAARGKGVHAHLEHTMEAAAQFVAVRPYGRAHNACLREALALLLFLGRTGGDADWVFGVKGAPFVAHCWVQQRGVVLNDTAEHVLAYTPILVV